MVNNDVEKIVVESVKMYQSLTTDAGRKYYVESLSRRLALRLSSKEREAWLEGITATTDHETKEQ